MKNTCQCVFDVLFLHIGGAMRTNIDIDDALLAEAQKLSGKATKKAVVEEGLLTLIRLKRQAKIRAYRGKLQWTGDLDKMRTEAVRTGL